jgi:hypothetical protein
LAADLAPANAFGRAGVTANCASTLMQNALELAPVIHGPAPDLGHDLSSLDLGQGKARNLREDENKPKT